MSSTVFNNYTFCLLGPFCGIAFTFCFAFPFFAASCSITSFSSFPLLFLLSFCYPLQTFCIFSSQTFGTWLLDRCEQQKLHCQRFCTQFGCFGVVLMSLFHFFVFYIFAQKLALLFCCASLPGAIFVMLEHQFFFLWLLQLFCLFLVIFESFLKQTEYNFLKFWIFLYIMLILSVCEAWWRKPLDQRSSRIISGTAQLLHTIHPGFLPQGISSLSGRAEWKITKVICICLHFACGCPCFVHTCPHLKMDKWFVCILSALFSICFCTEKVDNSHLLNCVFTTWLNCFTWKKKHIIWTGKFMHALSENIHYLTFMNAQCDLKFKEHEATLKSWMHFCCNEQEVHCKTSSNQHNWTNHKNAPMLSTFLRENWGSCLIV